MRQYGTQNPRQIYSKRHGVYAIVLRRNHILLTLQHDTPPDIQLPGGGIDLGEHPITALHREIREETGWRVNVTRRLGAFRRFTYMPEYDLWAEKICAVYLVEPVLRLGPPSDAAHSPVWTSLNNAVKMLKNPGDRDFVRKLIS